MNYGGIFFFLFYECCYDQDDRQNELMYDKTVMNIGLTSSIFQSTYFE